MKVKVKVKTYTRIVRLCAHPGCGTFVISIYDLCDKHRAHARNLDESNAL